MKQPSITVLLPTYNEAGNIIPLIRAIQTATPKHTRILVLDDNSPDGTANLVRAYRQKTKIAHVDVLERTKNRGLTNSLKDGIAKTTSDIVVWMDCDFSHPPQLIAQLLTEITNGADISIATRFGAGLAGHPDINRAHNQHFVIQAGVFLSIMLNKVLSFIFGTNITDYTTGFLAVRRTVLTHIPLSGDYGEYCIDLLVRAHASGFLITEIPYVSPPRRSGESKTAPDIRTLFRRGTGYLRTLVSLIWATKIINVPTMKLVLPPNGIRPMTLNDAADISKLHILALPTTIARIGKPYLQDLYKALSADVVLVAVNHGTIIGCISATKDLAGTQRRLSRILFKPSNAWSIIRAVAIGRVRFKELVQRASFERALAHSFPHPYATILTFFVDPKHQHRGVGTQLLRAVENKFAPGTNLFVDTQTANTNARTWYASHGFRVVKTIADNEISVKRLTSAPI